MITHSLEYWQVPQVQPFPLPRLWQLSDLLLYASATRQVKTEEDQLMNLKAILFLVILLLWFDVNNKHQKP